MTSGDGCDDRRRRSGRREPHWWPENEQWPPKPGPGQEQWASSGKRFFRRAVTFVVVVLALPLVVAIALTIALGGWASVLAAVIGYLTLLIILAGAVRLMLRTWRPVQSLMQAAGRLADGDYGARMDPVGSTQWAPMTSSFNRMAERLESSEEERRRLLADIGHELRTPLTIIRGEVEAMVDGVHPPDPDRLRAMLGDIEMMEHLLTDLQTMSTAEAGMLRIHREPTDVTRLVDDVLERFATEAGVGEVTLTLVADGPVDAEIDPVRVQEVVTNLVRNALRATPPGGRVAVSVSADTARSRANGDRSATDQRTGGIAIEVSDTGRGIDPDDVERLFERFQKGPESDGTGLGLTISRSLVDAHGGTLSLESVQGSGTTLTVSLPAAAPS
ncbi:MAG: HAMP domain-containing sensor histidine kinase [Actinomycetota bacterium]